MRAHGGHESCFGDEARMTSELEPELDTARLYAESAVTTTWRRKLTDIYAFTPKSTRRRLSAEPPNLPHRHPTVSAPSPRRYTYAQCLEY
jgi:hypothetical protein